MKHDQHLPLRLKVFHGFGSIAYGVKDNGFSTFLLLFYNQVLGMDAGLVSAALMLALFIDAFADPIIGYLSDRTYTRFGRRLPWLYAAPIPLALAWIAMWSPPEGMGGYIFLYLVVIAILVRTLLSCCEVPSVALVPELTQDYDERTLLMRFRYLFGWAGGLLMLFLAFGVFLVPDEGHAVGQLNPEGYWAYGLTGGALIAVAVLFSAAMQHKRVARWPDKKPDIVTPREALHEIRESFRNRAFLILMGAAATALVAQGVIFSLSNYFYLYVWKFSQTAFNIYPLLLFASVIGAFLLVGPVTKRFEKPRSASACMVFSAVVLITPFILRLAGFWPEVGTTVSTGLFFVFMFIANVASVIVMITGSSMIADVVEDSEVQTGRRSEGLFYAGYFFAQKCATGLGLFISGLIISWAGLSEKTNPADVLPQVVDRLTEAYIVIALLLALVATAFFRRFPIGRDDHARRIGTLAAESGKTS